MGDIAIQGVQNIAETETEDAVQYLTFIVDSERFAIGILDVKELIEVGNMTQVPMTPDFIRGVINLRGNVVSVVDLASRMRRKTSQLTKRSCIVLVEVSMDDGESQMIGMLVDQVNEILEILPAQIQPAPNFGTDIRTDFIKAMGRVDDEFIILLDINHVLSVDELSSMDKVRALAQQNIELPALQQD